MAVSILGEVMRICTLDFGDLRAMPQVEDVDKQVKGRLGSAVRMRELLERAGRKSGATHATLASSDGSFTASVPINDVLDALLVYRIGDEPLPIHLGGPIRFLIPDAAPCHSGGADVCANVKSLASITLTQGEQPDSRADKPHDA
jgi:DMSO/TMAO reductase YedYZ molybdopterin-dependent catalytic subunit